MIDVGADLQKAYDEGYEAGKRDAAAAIEELQAEVKRLKDGLSFSESSADEFQMQAALQNALLAKQIPHWASVEDESPPKGFALIGARKRPPEISEDVWDMWVCEYDGEWGWQDMDGYALSGITHWMPIEPPQEETK